MAWKNLQQTTLVDAMLIEHEALKELFVGVNETKTMLLRNVSDITN